jgi:4-amino-4-deoxy-L-arabinose transferase-like glycosyltransferase
VQCQTPLIYAEHLTRLSRNVEVTTKFMSTVPQSSVPHASLRQAIRLAALFAALKLLLHFVLTLWSQHVGYGYFRDEFYYLACGHHLAWGYVDHGPIVAVQARLGEILFGDSVFAIRILSAVAGALTVFLGGLLCWALGGRRSAQALAMLGLLCCPQYIGVDGFLSMNSYEPVFWSVCLLAILMLARGASGPGAAPAANRSLARWWTIFGLSAGIGLLNKPSIVFFLAALALALLVSPQRRLLFNRWAALGIAILILLALPYLHWQIANHFPTLEFLHNGRVGGKNTVLNPWRFFLAQFYVMSPLSALLWITGVVALLRARSIRDARWLGLTYLFFFALMCAMHAKDYYLEGIYPAFFAAGAIAWEHRFGPTPAADPSAPRRRSIAIPIYVALLIITSLLILPMASPVFAPATWVRYTKAVHLPHDNTETAATGPLPQFFADRFGWRQMTDEVTATFRSLSPSDRAQACILANNYGEAGAIDFFNRIDHLGLPPAISGHNNYWLWGPHGCTGKVVIDISGATPAELKEFYGGVEPVAKLDNPWAMPFEHRTIYILRDRNANLQQDWLDFKHYF